MKYLFEMIGLYPPADDESEGQSSLAQTLLQHLGITEGTDPETTTKKVTARRPLELK